MQTHAPDAHYTVGCLMIAEPVFFGEQEWIAQPRDWRPNIVQGKTYDLAQGAGLEVWEACLERANRSRPELLVAEAGPRFGAPVPVCPRLGQGTFRIAVTEAYDRACAVTSEHSLPVLEAAHIRPYSEGGEHRVQNGLLLRTDIHRLFDRGYVTITPDYHFEVSRRLDQEWHNGVAYYKLHGSPVRGPRRAEDHPEREALVWHNERVFLG